MREEVRRRGLGVSEDADPPRSPSDFLNVHMPSVVEVPGPRRELALPFEAGAVVRPVARSAERLLQREDARGTDDQRGVLALPKHDE